MLDIIETSCPIAREQALGLCRPVDIDGRGKMGVVQFEETILWLRQGEADAAFIHGGQILSTPAGYCDHSYSFLSSLRATLDDARRLISKFGVDRTSTLRLDVTATVTDTPVLRAECPAHSFRRGPCYAAVPKDWRVLDDTDAPGEALRPVPVLRSVVWSTANDDVTNEALLAEFRRAVAVP